MKHLQCLLNGEWTTIADARISVLTHTLHYATGVFEGLRCYNGKIFKLEDHTKRLLRSAKLLGFEVPYSEEQLNRWQIEVIERNHLVDAYIRPLIYLGEGSMNLDIYHHPIQVLISAWPWGAIHNDKDNAGIKLQTVSIHKLATNSTKIKAKAVGHYLNSALALREAKLAGADEALLLDQKWFVCEGSGQNLFFVKKGKLFTPTLETALDGITRAAVIEIAKKQGISVTEGNFTLEEFMSADEVFLTGTASEVVGVKNLNDQAIGTGNYPITKALQKAYHILVNG